MSNGYSLTWLLVIAMLAGVVAFLFGVTRGALLVRSAIGDTSAAAHVYPIYSNRRLIELIDFQPIISAILLFQYSRLVSAITQRLQDSDLQGKDVLITSCAFGNLIPRVVSAAMLAGARRVQITDLVPNELEHARNKLGAFAMPLEFVEGDATRMQQADGSVAANVMFFLLHELPNPLKAAAVREAGRLLEPGGTLYLAEFHRPTLWLLRALSWSYLKAFEPWGLSLWGTHDPVHQLQAMGGFSCTRHTCLFGNFQVIVATKHARA